jgi:hypothetical protein
MRANKRNVVQRNDPSSGARETDAHPVSTMYVVTFSGVTSGGIMTSGTTCWTCTRVLRTSQPPAPRMVGLGMRMPYIWNIKLFDQRSDNSALSDALCFFTRD